MNESPDDIGTLIEPTPVGFSFDSPGWYAVLIALVVLMIVVVAWLVVRYRRNRYRRQALSLIDSLASAEPNTAIYESNFLLKRIALRLAPRNAVAGLRHDEWIAFLNKTASAEVFSSEAIAMLGTVYTGKNTAAQATSFLAMARVWIRRHAGATRDGSHPEGVKPKPAGI